MARRLCRLARAGSRWSLRRASAAATLGPQTARLERELMERVLVKRCLWGRIYFRRWVVTPPTGAFLPRGEAEWLLFVLWWGAWGEPPPLLYWPCPGAAFSWVLLWFGCFFSLPWTFTADLIRTILHCFFPRYRWSCWRWRLGSAVNPPEWFSVGVICLLSKATEKSCAGGGAYLESWGTEWFLKLCFHIGVFQVVCSLVFFSCDLALFTLSATYNWVSELKWKCAFLHW